MEKKYRVQLTAEEQEELRDLVSKGRTAAYRQTHAHILLLSYENQVEGGMKDVEIARALKVGTATVERVRQRCVEEGLERALGRKEQINRRAKKLDGQGEAHLIAMACSQPPQAGPVGRCTCWRSNWWSRR
ncbi:MAG: helix-turn-helix domain-containing protein [Chloroflexi bacterium]|nr:helix-turn-helix domain-containing protein [Chloroflexota bacterium]MYE38797.1 helix-turn-helix domain-containing protein [Chloroflexota bacterium]